MLKYGDRRQDYLMPKHLFEEADRLADECFALSDEEYEKTSLQEYIQEHGSEELLKWYKERKRIVDMYEKMGMTLA